MSGPPSDHSRVFAAPSLILGGLLRVGLRSDYNEQPDAVVRAVGGTFALPESPRNKCRRSDDGGPFSYFKRSAKRAFVNRWTSVLGALMLVLVFWTGGAAHAAESFRCVPATAEAAGHFEGDSDQTPADRGQDVAHHHSGCSGNHVAATADAPVVDFPYLAGSIALVWREAGVSGRGPDSELRPPIA